MKTKRSNILGAALQDFLGDHLSGLRGVSPNTILSYRDSLKLLLQFLAQKESISASNLDIENIGPEEVIAFLEHLEADRQNGIGTRNVRLSAIHSFFRYLAGRHPEYLERSQRILSIPFKRAKSPSIDYLEFEEITAVLEAVDRSRIRGRRDYALLSFMFNSGSRAQEVVDLKVSDLQLSKPFSAHICGKGRKTRVVPIWPQTAQVLREYIEGRNGNHRETTPVFENHLGKPLTRFGVGYILAKYLRRAAVEQPSLRKKRLHPHSMRHSCAVYLLKSGVDIATISHWLGHASVNTVNIYATIDIEMKRKALEKAKPLDGGNGKNTSSWKKKPDILKWLASL